MNIKSIIVFSFCFVNSYSYATDPDTTYIQNFKNIFALKTFVVQNGFKYSITPRNSTIYSSSELNDAQVLYSPFISPSLGVSINIKGVGLSYVFKLKDDFWDTTQRAKSDFKQLNFNVYKIKFGLEIYYQDYRRFYFHFKGDERLQTHYNNNIRAYQWGTNAILIPNGKKFSYNAAFNQTAFQKKSAGSFLLMFAFKFNEIKSDFLIPHEVQKYFLNNEFTRNRNYSLLIYPGFGFNLIHQKFYFSTAVWVGLGPQLQTYSFPESKDVKLTVPLVTRAKAGMGFNGKLFYTGIFANAEANESWVKPVKTQQLIYSLGGFVGLRFIVLKKTKTQIRQEKKRIRLIKKEAKAKADADEKDRKRELKTNKRKKISK